VFSVSDPSSKSGIRFSSRMTFSSTVPKRSVVAKISGSASRDSRMVLA
jgi:hypothetical protein